MIIDYSLSNYQKGNLKTQWNKGTFVFNDNAKRV